MSDGNRTNTEKGLFIPTAEANRTVTNPDRTKYLASRLVAWAKRRTHGR